MVVMQLTIWNATCSNIEPSFLLTVYAYKIYRTDQAAGSKMAGGGKMPSELICRWVNGGSIVQ
jgi:hypothetical protein